MEIQSIRHSWPEKAGFDLMRPNGAPEYILVHFLSPAEFMLADKWHHLVPGDLLVMTPYMPHRLLAQQPLLHDWMHITGDVAAELKAFDLDVNSVYHIKQSEQVTERIAKLESEFFARNQYWQNYTQALLNELWITISRQVNGAVVQSVVEDAAARLRELRTEMILHPEHAWTNEDMARYLNVSVSRLFPLYKSLFSISPKQDLILMRMEKAKRLLQQGVSVVHTAEQLRYNSTYHFIRQFRQQTGMTPGKWALSYSMKE